MSNVSSDAIWVEKEEIENIERMKVVIEKLLLLYWELHYVYACIQVINLGLSLNYITTYPLII